MGSKTCAIAVDLGGTNLRGGIVDSGGKLHVRHEVSTARDKEGFLEQLTFLCEHLRAESETRKLEPAGIGLALPGFLIQKTGTIQFSPNLRHLGGLDVRKILSDKFHLPCLVENDGNCAALGEWWVGSAKGCNHVIVLTLGTGVGGGLISDGRLIRGTNGSGGEVGHVCVDPDGPPCLCGSNGCLETFASGGAL
jgi:glucokinase